MPNFQTRFQITKVDADRHEVGGIITAEVVDKDGEVCDYATSKPHFQAWSNEFKAATGGKSQGNVREQHSLKAVGKFIDIQFDDANKSIHGTAKIVDDQAWQKCADGVYTGFSIGGITNRTWFDSKLNARKFTAVPREVSIVDNPACGVSHFEFVRAGEVTLKKFAKFDASSVQDEKDPYIPPDPLLTTLGRTATTTCTAPTSTSTPRSIRTRRTRPPPRSAASAAWKPRSASAPSATSAAWQ